MKELEELTREIREKLPRLMELSEGQNLKSLIADPANDICKDSYYTVGYHEDYYCKIENEHIEIGGYIYIVNRDFEIIGKEPMLNDVMQYLWKLVEEESENSDDVIFAIGQLNNVFDQHCWNFNFPYLKDQSPELIKFLHSLIKTKQ
ncbi:hypothetical protein ACVVIH_12975 [Chryseobacterium arthrosphaerae]|uniref:hypothetical protein n=1 Tax=Chryseobacterium arthrosphaerae TaxID=651561 RepID=UPI00241EC402|nr:hypothetical protein [Chryseobacterium arthrosphaerae]